MEPGATVLARFTWNIFDNPSTATAEPGVLEAPIKYRIIPLLRNCTVSRTSTIRDVLSMMHGIYSLKPSIMDVYMMAAYCKDSSKRLNIVKRAEEGNYTYADVATMEFQPIQIGVGPIMTGLVRIKGKVHPCFLDPELYV